MLTISRLTVENLENGCVTDVAAPRFSFSLSSDNKHTALKKAVLQIGGWQKETTDQIAVIYDGPALQPFTNYTALVTATDTNGETAAAQVSFQTGRMGQPWQAEWISDPKYHFTEKKVSPVPMTFRKKLSINKELASAKLYATALGIYELMLDGKKVGTQYFAPGFTSYKSQLQYQVYDVTDMLSADSTLMAVVAGGWAVGSFVFTRINRHDGDRQAFLCELRLTYADGTEEIIGTDTSWEVTEDGNYRMADIYDGETYDATIDLNSITWRKAARETLRISPKLLADYGNPVREHEVFTPISCHPMTDGTLIYDFGQNFAGVVRLEINGKSGQVITVKHAEILNPDGTINVSFLRTAKATATYTCRDGIQVYQPRLTYMGFRYISVEGIKAEDIKITAIALYSDVTEAGTFSCSNEMINQLQSNVCWGAKSNFVDIPNTVPVQGYGFPATMPSMAIDFWGDACVMVPWAEYQARGDINILKKMYPVMKKYVNACKFWAGLLSFGKKRYIWNTPSVLHFGDDGTDTMISYNHYASGAVGAFLYQRIAGIEATKPGYKEFRIKPLIGGGITSARGSVFTPYGEIDSDWKVVDELFTIEITVPVGSSCTLTLPNGETHSCDSGCYTFQTLSYVIDVYRKDLPHETHFGYYALFVSFFPQLVAGPIERPGSLLPQLKQEYTFQIEDLRHGFRQILIGFFKKIVVADYLAGFADAVFATPGKAVCRPCIQAIFCKRTDCYTYPETDRDAHACMLCMDFFPCTDAF